MLIQDRKDRGTRPNKYISRKIELIRDLTMLCPYRIRITHKYFNHKMRVYWYHTKTYSITRKQYDYCVNTLSDFVKETAYKGNILHYDRTYKHGYTYKDSQAYKD
jgi:hypothetical protein